MKRTSLGPNRTRYAVRRPELPTRIAVELLNVLVTSVAGAGLITLLLWWLGVVR